MDPARTLLDPAISKPFRMGITHQWNARAPSTLTTIFGMKMGVKRAITLNFDPYNNVVAFCKNYGFNPILMVEEIGSISLGTPTDIEKACAIIFSICTFTQESDKRFLQQIVQECPPVRLEELESDIDESCDSGAEEMP